MNTYRTLVFCLLIAVSTSVLRSAPLPESDPSTLTGSWEGRLHVSNIDLRLVLHIAETNGILTATMDSPEQRALGIPVSDVIARNDSLLFAVPSIQGRYAGRIQPDGTIDGQWSQGPVAIPLLLRRSEGDEGGSHRPQEPVKPYPYNAEQVSYANAAAGITLAGTLTTPSTGGPFPAVILISGSGPQDRDETILGHKPFLVLADALTRQGIAVLRFDDRGTGASTGSFGTATTEDFATDVEAGIQYLKSRPEIDPERMGLIGHSEGGLIAPMIAARSRDIAFLVLMAAPGVSGEEILLQQGALINRAAGRSDSFIATSSALQRRLLAIAKTSADTAELRRRLEAAFADATPAEQELIKEGKLTVNNQMPVLSSPWLRFFIAYNPVTALTKVQVPVLALTGGKDIQVPADENLSAIEKALKQGGNRQVTVKKFPGLNHLFQTADTGLPGEYGLIEETIAPDVLQFIGSWIEKQVRKK